MSTLFKERNYSHEDGQHQLFKNLINGFGFEDHEFELVPGDVSVTASEFTKKRPGFRISLLYLDLDLGEPTKACLEALWPRVCKGGIVVFDEYAFHKWSEANGVDEFFKDKDVELKAMNYICPSVCVVKK